MTKDEDEIKELVSKRRTAEEAIEGVDPALREKAFEVILQHLLVGNAQSPPVGVQTRRSTKKKEGTGERKGSTGEGRSPRAKKDGPKTLTKKLIDEGFFNDWKDPAQLQKRLRVKGHRYDVTPLRTALLRLTRDEVLQREQRQAEGGHESWVYRKLKA
jgi:hypothetical protein